MTHAVGLLLEVNKAFMDKQLRIYVLHTESKKGAVMAANLLRSNGYKCTKHDGVQFYQLRISKILK